MSKNIQNALTNPALRTLIQVNGLPSVEKRKKARLKRKKR